MEELFKVCQKCGTVCREEIDACPSLIRGTLNICNSTSFRLATEEEFKKIKEQKLNFYYKKWPQDIWPVSGT